MSPNHLAVCLIHCHNLDYESKTQTNYFLFLFIALSFLLNVQTLKSQTKTEPLRIGVIGLSHSHVGWILRRPDKGDVKMVGIVEANREFAQRRSDHYGFSMDIVFDSIEEMIDATHPEAVNVFGPIIEHLKVVEVCAPLGIHVMVEKPFAVSLDHAKKMKALSEKYNIHLLTNYETSWYATNQKAYKMLHDGDIGDPRKVVVHDGHRGPVELGTNQEFLDWLTDPIKNGGGALTDFGCYGANLITWLTKGKRPEAVMAITQTIKPDIYPKVDDEATIVLQYPKMQGIIQASWNWPIDRKDMEVYGRTGYVISENRHDLRFRLNRKEAEQKIKLGDRPSPYNDPFALLEAVVRNKITLAPYDLYSVENNLIAVEILDAARESAKTGRLIKLEK